MTSCASLCAAISRVKQVGCSCSDHCLFAFAIHQSNSSIFNSGGGCNMFPSITLN